MIFLGIQSKIEEICWSCISPSLQGYQGLSKRRIAGHYKYVQANAGNPAPSRRRLDTNKSIILKQLKKMYLSDHITIEAYIKNIEDEYDFLALDRMEAKEKG